jgi:hypothetical protein
MPSIFTSNNLVSASKALEASQVTMLKVVDQNNAFLLTGESLQSSEHAIDSQSKTVGKNMIQHGWKDHALDFPLSIHLYCLHFTKAAGP